GNDRLHGNVSHQLVLAGAAGFGLPAVNGFTPLGGGAGAANAMRPAACAFAETNVSGETAASSCQFESSSSWRSASGSARYVARIRRGSLSSAPIQICRNTSLLAHATMSVFVPPITDDGPM